MDAKLMLLFGCLWSASVNAQTLDPTFGMNGTVQHDIGGSERLFGATIQTDGRIVGCGLRDSSGIGHVMVCRFLEDGSFDPTFGDGGYVMLPTGTYSSDASEVMVQSDGRIVVAGKTTDAGVPQFMVRRLLANGSVDVDFGTDGVWTHPVGAVGGYVTDVAMDAEGRILLAGMVVPTNYLGAFAVARLDANGDLDTGFGNGGFFIRDESDQARPHMVTDMELLADGRIVVAGNTTDLSVGPDWNSDALCLRLTVNGQLDENFGNDGQVLVDLNGLQDGSERIRLLPGGELELFGTSGDNSTVNMVNRLRLTADGDVISTELIPVNSWSPAAQTKQIAGIEPGPGDVMAYIGSVPNGGTGDGFLGLLEPLPLGGAPYEAGYSTTVDAGDWTSYGGGAFDAAGRLVVVGLTTNADWIGQFPDQCGAFTDIHMARFRMPLMTGVSSAAAPLMTVWPVPADERLNVGCESCRLDELRLMDAAGRVVWSERRGAVDKTVIELGGVPTGVYYLMVESGSSSTVQRVVVQR
jgi:uncharacterized delta-60 repeat protein